MNTNDGSPGSLEESNHIIISTGPYGIPNRMYTWLSNTVVEVKL